MFLIWKAWKSGANEANPPRVFGGGCARDDVWVHRLDNVKIHIATGMDWKASGNQEQWEPEGNQFKIWKSGNISNNQISFWFVVPAN